MIISIDSDTFCCLASHKTPKKMLVDFFKVQPPFFDAVSFPLLRTTEATDLRRRFSAFIASCFICSFKRNSFFFSTFRMVCMRSRRLAQSRVTPRKFPSARWIPRHCCCCRTVLSRSEFWKFSVPKEWRKNLNFGPIFQNLATVESKILKNRSEIRNFCSLSF